MTVQVYFGNTTLNPDTMDCSLSFPVPREVPATSDPAGIAEAALTELLAGPMPAEDAEGYTSWFSDATEDDLIGVRVVGDTAYVNLVNHAQTISNASTSCGSAIYLSQLGNTVLTAAGVPNVLYAFEGDPAAFWDWLQVGCYEDNDNCDPAPFKGW